MATAFDQAVRSVFPTYNLVRVIFDKVAGTAVDASPTEQMSEVRAETERQENEMRRLEAQAKVAQEMAIAARIEGALEVQIEEFYEYAGEGKLGANIDEKSATLGLSGAGRRVSKRIYRFTGHSAVSEAAQAALAGPDEE
ncbi:hypothetical protein [uncultured Sphingomonas sp.]|uniref:hypothetical protein n=1 Tax=uncultured Sphingomonas sp. TaxID=158754 RepID=UPI003749FB23